MMNTNAAGKPIMSADTLRKDPVRNAQGDDLGKIEDFMLDLQSGQIRYAVLSLGGVFGIGDRLFAVPPEALAIDTDNKCLILNVDKDSLKDAPGFDKENWPNFADPTITNPVNAYYAPYL